MAADVWSVTSWNELRREAVEVEHWNLTHPDAERRWPFITQALHGHPGVVVAASDYMRAVQDQIAPWVQQSWCSLGTDGFGLADTRAAARRHFLVDAQSIVVATLQTLGQRRRVRRRSGQAGLRQVQARRPDLGRRRGPGRRRSLASAPCANLRPLSSPQTPYPGSGVAQGSELFSELRGPDPVSGSRAPLRERR